MAAEAVAGLCVAVGAFPLVPGTQRGDEFSLTVVASTVLVRLKLEPVDEGVAPEEEWLFKRGAAEGGPENVSNTY